MDEKFQLIFEKSKPGRVAYSLPPSDVEQVDLESKLPAHLLRDVPADLPEVSELQLVRHYTHLSQRTH